MYGEQSNAASQDQSLHELGKQLSQASNQTRVKGQQKMDQEQKLERLQAEVEEATTRLATFGIIIPRSTEYR